MTTLKKKTILLKLVYVRSVVAIVTGFLLFNLSEARTITADVEGFSKVPGGTFTMGNNPGETDAYAPPHYVTVSPFSMKSTEVTLSEWESVRQWGASNGYPSIPIGQGKSSNHPVHSVTWMDAMVWCNAYSEMLGLEPCYTDTSGAILRYQTSTPICKWSADGFRFPTEAEWEFAARGGHNRKKFPNGLETITQREATYTVWTYTDTNPFPYDESFDPNLNTGHDVRFTWNGEPYSCPVSYFSPNGYGLYGMAGNVSEWCWDWHTTNFYNMSNSSVDPIGPDDTASFLNKVTRGGSWQSYASMLRSSARAFQRPTRKDNATGFRVAHRPISREITVGFPERSPGVRDPFIVEIGTSSATVGGNITSSRGPDITERGIIYCEESTSLLPTLGNYGVTTATIDGTTGIFSGRISALRSATRYIFRAYATNSMGTSYTTSLSFTTLASASQIGNGQDVQGVVLNLGSSLHRIQSSSESMSLLVDDDVDQISVLAEVSREDLLQRVSYNGDAWLLTEAGTYSKSMALHAGTTDINVQLVTPLGNVIYSSTISVIRTAHRPDISIGRTPKPKFGALNFRDSDQILMLHRPKDLKSTWFVELMNRGNMADKFGIRANRVTGTFKIAYFNAGHLVTSEVLSSRYISNHTDPGERASLLKLVFSPSKVTFSRKRAARVIRKSQLTHRIVGFSAESPENTDTISILYKSKSHSKL